MQQDPITETSQPTTRDLLTKTHCSTAAAEDVKAQYTSTSVSIAGRRRRAISANVWRKQALIFC
ncbi:uncharacterized protein CTRU02_207507 [Colletotrichum truncatum]|uniref:Uncharacterized protein n=1 Tax=Colletotrichum truncatum TaxID=5467 RepID=A0ACC3Z111_COLTU|nr:uncharacterized protein CTRU02_15818 [Colletotrichum truncatum]XP_036588815.1 uncharacterized protein CTRU02_00862 [Colletotrichum truncatum]KAF6780633.1 hypothetical protein CTRU02_15818 [Colletotrichum truncatum]KAF6800457.1 hypothetical protein CTRU02_00862 [Colletotrichum truncatum]